MLDLSTYAFTIFPLIAVYLGVWILFKLWKNSSKKQSTKENDNNDPFSRAINFVGKQKNLSNDSRLAAYALFKQVKFGDCDIEKPALYDMVGVAKWDAWNNIKGISKEAAKEAYLELAQTLGWDPKDESSSSTQKGGGGGGGGVMGPVQSTMSDDMGGDVDRRKNFEGGEELFKAASEGDLEAIRSFLGVPGTLNDTKLLNCRDEDNEQTPLHWACDRGQVDAVQLLLSYPGIDVNVADKTGMSPLHYAVACEYEEVVNLLMLAGADPDQEDEDGETPMNMADSEELKHILRPVLE